MNHIYSTPPLPTLIIHPKHTLLVGLQTPTAGPRPGCPADRGRWSQIHISWLSRCLGLAYMIPWTREGSFVFLFGKCIRRYGKVIHHHSAAARMKTQMRITTPCGMDDAKVQQKSGAKIMSLISFLFLTAHRSMANAMRLYKTSGSIRLPFLQA